MVIRFYKKRVHFNSIIHRPEKEIKEQKKSNDQPLNFYYILKSLYYSP